MADVNKAPRWGQISANMYCCAAAKYTHFIKVTNRPRLGWHQLSITSIYRPCAHTLHSRMNKQCLLTSTHFTFMYLITFRVLCHLSTDQARKGSVQPQRQGWLQELRHADLWRRVQRVRHGKPPMWCWWSFRNTPGSSILYKRYFTIIDQLFTATCLKWSHISHHR